MKEYSVSFRCYYEGGTRHTQHRQTLPLADIPKWIDAYKFTHPYCEAVTVKVWLDDGKEGVQA